MTQFGEGVEAALISAPSRTTAPRSSRTTAAALLLGQGHRRGDTTGQDVGDVWYVLAPDGKVVDGDASLPRLPAADATISVATDSSLGKILVGDKGLSLYMYTKDTNGGPSVCYDRCAVAWPPLLTRRPRRGRRRRRRLLTVTDRTDGTKQVSYAGWPLYYYEKDTAAGDVIGQDVGQVWYVLAPDGKVIGMQGAAAPAEPAAAAMTPTLSTARQRRWGRFWSATRA